MCACADNSADGNVQQAIESIHHSIDRLKIWRRKAKREKTKMQRRGAVGEARRGKVERKEGARRDYERQIGKCIKFSADRRNVNGLYARHWLHEHRKSLATSCRLLVEDSLPSLSSVYFTR